MVFDSVPANVASKNMAGQRAEVRKTLATTFDRAVNSIVHLVKGIRGNSGRFAFGPVNGGNVHGEKNARSSELSVV